MVRIVGVTLPENKNIEIALTYIYGIGRSLSGKILAACHIHPHTKVKNLSEEEVDRIRRFVEKNYKTEGDLRREILMNIKRLKEIGCYRGERHKKNLPVRGQRTRTNARTKRGKRVCVGSGRKEPPAPK